MWQWDFWESSLQRSQIFWVYVFLPFFFLNVLWMGSKCGACILWPQNYHEGRTQKNAQTWELTFLKCWTNITTNLSLNISGCEWTQHMIGLYQLLGWVSYYCCLVSKSCLTPFDLMDCGRQAPLSMGFPRQEYWSGLPFLQGIFRTQRLNPHLLHWQEDCLPLNHLGSPRFVFLGSNF